MADTHTSECVQENTSDPIYGRDSGRITYPTGAVRSDCAEGVRFDLISPIATERDARTMAEGAVNYGDRNWERGFPASVLINHTLNHLNNWLLGDCTEDHLSHARCNLGFLMHFEHTRPDLMDIPSRQHATLIPGPATVDKPRTRDARSVA